MTKKKLRYGSTSAAITALVVAIVIFVNVVFTFFSAKFLWYSDMTSSNLFTLSDEAKALLDTIDAPIKIIFAAEADKRFAELKAVSSSGSWMTIWYMSENGG